MYQVVIALSRYKINEGPSLTASSPVNSPLTHRPRQSSASRNSKHSKVDSKEPV